MNPSHTSQHERRREERRRAIKQLTPTHHCPRCTALLYPDDERCLECELPRPKFGWSSLQDSVDPWLGRKVKERYLLTKCIGKGASATVYLAESLGISRQFALKVIHPPRHKRGPTSDQIAARLEREVEALGRLRNPHVVRFYDVVELPLDHVAVVMDFVRGLTLEELIHQEGQLPVKRAVNLLRQAANGVYEAHLLGMTHRDLKPENLLVERLPAGDEFVHVLDFGIVQVEGESQVTQGFVGTPLYASPEQALGDGIDFRSDIYSMGALLFFMLTGRPPFLGKTVVEVLKQHVDTTAPTISSLRRDQGVPEPIERLAAAMLAKSPSKRPQSLAEVIQQLDAWIAKNSDVSSTLTDSPDDLLLHPPEAPPLMRDSAEFEVLKKHAASTIPRAAAIRKNASEPHDTKEKPGPKAKKQKGAGVFAAAVPQSGIFNRIKRSTPSSPPPSTPTPAPTTPPRPLTASTLHRGHIARHGDTHLVYLDGDLLWHWDIASNQARCYPLPDPHLLSALALNASHVLIGRGDGKIDLLDLDHGTTQTLFSSVFDDAVSSVALSHDGETLWALMHSGRIYHSPAQKPMSEWVRVSGGSMGRHIVLCPNGKFLAIVRQGGLVEIARVHDPKTVYTSLDAQKEVLDISFSEDGYLVAILDEEGDLKIYNVLHGAPMAQIEAPENLLVFFFTKNNQIKGLTFSTKEGLLPVDMHAVRAI